MSFLILQIPRLSWFLSCEAILNMQHAQGGVDVLPVPVTDFYLGLPSHLLKSCTKETSASLSPQVWRPLKGMSTELFFFEGGWHWVCSCWCSVAVGPAAASAEKDCSSTIQQSKFVLTIPVFCIKGTGNWKIFGLTEVLEWHSFKSLRNLTLCPTGVLCTPYHGDG